MIFVRREIDKNTAVVVCNSSEIGEMAILNIGDTIEWIKKNHPSVDTFAFSDDVKNGIMPINSDHIDDDDPIMNMFKEFFDL